MSADLDGLVVPSAHAGGHVHYVVAVLLLGCILVAILRSGVTRRHREAPRPDPVPPPPWSPSGMVAGGLLLAVTVVGGLEPLLHRLLYRDEPKGDIGPHWRAQLIAVLVAAIGAALLLRPGRRVPRLVAVGLLIGIPFVMVVQDFFFLADWLGDG